MLFITHILLQIVFKDINIRDWAEGLTAMPCVKQIPKNALYQQSSNPLPKHV